VIYITAISADLDIGDQSADLVISHPAEYYAAYDHILRSIYSGNNLQVHVRHKRVAGWLNVMAQRYGSEIISFTSLTVRSYLEGHIGIAIPSQYTEADIKASGLLQLNIPASTQTSFEDYILEIFFGSFFNKPEMASRVNEILAAYDVEQWHAALRRPIVKKILQERFRKLKAESNGKPAVLQLLEWLEKSPEVYIRNLSGLKLLRYYDVSLGKRMLGSTYNELIQLNLDLHRIPVITRENEDVLTEIRLYLKQVTSKDDATRAFEEILEHASGFLEEELRAAIKVLGDKKEGITLPDIKRVVRKFSYLQNHPHIAQELSDLELLISVPVPPEPEDSWPLDKWMEWAVEKYLPYRFWLENTSRLDDQIGDLAGKYADWLFDHYGELLYNSSRMTWKAMLELREKLKSHTGPVLVVVLDNFNLKYYPLLRQQLQQQGFFEKQMQACLSMLPTFTEVSKKCIITGHYEPFQGSYADAVRSTWEPKLEKRVCYLANIHELRQMTERHHDIYFLNYIPIDYVLHQSDSHTGIAHRQSIQAYLEVLTQDIRAFANRIGADRDLMVIFTSDHGSTRIPSTTVNVLQGALYKKNAIDEHHRFMAISDEDAAKLSKQVEYDCYLFKRTQYHLPQNYLVARRLYRFRPTNDSIYIHGGLTPEETIIPLAVYQPFITAPHPLGIKIISPTTIMAGTRFDLVLEITNRNSYPVEDLLVEIASANLDAAPIMIDEIPQLQRQEHSIKARCVSGADLSEVSLIIRMSFKFNKQGHEQPAVVPVKYDTLLKAKSSLDDL
jgi:hypothetical protein